MRRLGLGRLGRVVPVPEVLDGVLQVEDVQDHEEPRRVIVERDLDAAGHLAGVDAVVDDPAPHVGPAKT